MAKSRFNFIKSRRTVKTGISKFSIKKATHGSPARFPKPQGYQTEADRQERDENYEPARLAAWIAAGNGGG